MNGGGSYKVNKKMGGGKGKQKYGRGRKMGRKGLGTGNRTDIWRIRKVAEKRERGRPISGKGGGGNMDASQDSF